MSSLETVKAMTGELADYAEEGGLSSVDADDLRAQILGVYECLLARAEKAEAALSDLLKRIDDLASMGTRDPIDQNYIAVLRDSWEMLHATAGRVADLGASS